MTKHKKSLIETPDRLDLISQMIEDVLTRNSVMDKAGLRQRANDAIDAVWDLRCDFINKNGIED